MSVMAVPEIVFAAGWIPFAVVLLLVLIFSFIYIRCYQNHTDKELCSTVTAIAGLSVALLTCAIVPVDIFLTSFMKTDDGKFKEWAVSESTRNSVESLVMNAYYALYGCVILFLFMILPFAYFHYEENDEDSTWRTRFCSSVKYMSVFLIIALVLVVIGAFVPFDTPSINNITDSTDWKSDNNSLFDFTYHRGQTALYFVVSALTVVGVLLLVIYTASGMSSWPVMLIKGVHAQELELPTSETARRLNVPWSRQEARSLSRQNAGGRQPQSHRCWRRCLFLLRPFEIIGGLLLLLLALLVTLTLLLSNIDKIINSSGVKTSYVLIEPKLPNPLDISLVFLQKVFPLDYIFMCALVMFFFFCSMAAVQNIGIWFCWIRMYRVRVQHTKPQALLFLCFLLMLIVLALTVFTYQLAPQYMTYGSQHYTTENGTKNATLKACTSQASTGECVPTRVSVILYQVFYKFWFFGVIYYWAMWAFLLVFVVAFIVSVVRRRNTVVADIDSSDEEYHSDDELVHE